MELNETDLKKFFKIYKDINIIAEEIAMGFAASIGMKYDYLDIKIDSTIEIEFYQYGFGYDDDYIEDTISFHNESLLNPEETIKELLQKRKENNEYERRQELKYQLNKSILDKQRLERDLIDKNKEIQTIESKINID